MDQEQWLPIPGFAGRYEASNLGRLRVAGVDRTGRKRYMGRVLSGAQNRYGYINHCLPLPDGKRKNITAHQAVALAFLGPRPDGHVVNHKNGNKADNRVGNIEWRTPSENHRHALANGLFKPPAGANHWNVGLPADAIRAMRQEKRAGAFNRELAAKYGVSIGSVSRYVNRVGRVDAH